MDKLYDSTESKKIIELAYTFISLAIKKNTSKPYNLRIAILKHGENIFIEDILDFWKLRDITLGRVAAIMIFNHLLVTDIENISELYLEQPFFKKLNNQLDDAINSALFHPLYSKDKIAESGFDLHKMLLENLMKN